MNKKGFIKWVKFFALLFLIALVYLIFKRYVLIYLKDILPVNYTNTIESILIFIVILILNYFFVKFSSALLRSYLVLKGEKRDVKLLISVYKYTEWVLVIFVTLSLLFKQVGSLITSLGLIGFGATFALQKPILNFVGWITIVFNHVYKIGDKVTINNISGQVYDVKLMYTAMAELNQVGDLTGKSVTVPNEFVLTSAVINFSKGTDYVWDELHLYFTYQSNIKKAVNIIEKTTQEYYNKNIKKEAIKILKDKSKNYEKILVRVLPYEKGVHIKVRLMIDFNKANAIKSEIYTLLLDKLKVKDIVLGKIEDIKTDSYKFLG